MSVQQLRPEIYEGTIIVSLNDKETAPATNHL